MEAMSYFQPLLTCVKSDDHLSTPFVDLINCINSFKGPQLTTKLNNMLLKLYLLYRMYVQERAGTDIFNFHHLKSSKKLEWSLSKSCSAESTKGIARVIQSAKSTEAK